MLRQKLTLSSSGMVLSCDFLWKFYLLLLDEWPNMIYPAVKRSPRPRDNLSKRRCLFPWLWACLDPTAKTCLFPQFTMMGCWRVFQTTVSQFTLWSSEWQRLVKTTIRLHETLNEYVCIRFLWELLPMILMMFGFVKAALRPQDWVTSVFALQHFPLLLWFFCMRKWRKTHENKLLYVPGRYSPQIFPSLLIQCLFLV